MRAKKPPRLPTVLDVAEARQLLAGVDGVPGLMARLMYGTGLRLSDVLQLRVKARGVVSPVDHFWLLRADARHCLASPGRMNRNAVAGKG